MSRCFPFPPPGYEKKARIDDVDLLKKEKHKEKKHKKEKKDKEKREDKDRKEKDKSDGKHKDTKDRKEKSKEKRKDKEREKDRSKASTSREKKIPAQVESCNGDHEFDLREREQVKEHDITSNAKKHNTSFRGHIGEKPMEKNLYDEGGMDKFVLDLCGRIKDGEKGFASQSMDRSPFGIRTNHDRMLKNEIGIMPVEKGKEKDRRVDIKKMDGQGVNVDSTSSVRTVVQNILGKEKIENKGVNTGESQHRGDAIPRFLDKSIEQRDKIYTKESEDKRRSKRKDKDKEKKSHGKDKEREKEKKKERRKEEKAKGTNEQKIKNHVQDNDSIKNGHNIRQNIKSPPFVPEGGRNLGVSQTIKLPQVVPDSERNFISGQNTKLPPIGPDGDRNLILGQNIKLPPFPRDGERTVVEGNLKKRKDIEANGFSHESNVVLNKKPRPTPHPSIENGRKLESCQTPLLHTLEQKVLPPNNLVNVNTNEHRVNGKIEVQPLSISSKKPSSSSSSSSSKTKADQAAKAPPVKPPHPDTKYLSEILSVPKIEEWCGFDDEEWILSRKGGLSVSVGPTEVSETPSVWAEAVQIESADVFALPYVIPY